MNRRAFLATLGLGALAARFGRLPEAAAPAPVWQHETLRSGFTLSGQKLLRKMPPVHPGTRDAFMVTEHFPRGELVVLSRAQLLAGATAHDR